jgi:hypothetical protein
VAGVHLTQPALVYPDIERTKPCFGRKSSKAPRSSIPDVETGSGHQNENINSTVSSTTNIFTKIIEQQDSDVKQHYRNYTILHLHCQEALNRHLTRKKKSNNLTMTQNNTNNRRQPKPSRSFHANKVLADLLLKQDNKTKSNTLFPLRGRETAHYCTTLKTLSKT